LDTSHLQNELLAALPAAHERPIAAAEIFEPLLRRFARRRCAASPSRAIVRGVGNATMRAGELSAIKTSRRFVVVLPSLDGRHERPDPNRPRSTRRVVMARPERVCRICGEEGEPMASLVCLASRNLRQRFRWCRLGVDCLASTQARSMGISNGAAKSAPITVAACNHPRSCSQII
jgi:hypothetical protein